MSNRSNYIRGLDEQRYVAIGGVDVSGQDIPLARLQAVPEAICTIEEESEVELGQ